MEISHHFALDFVAVFIADQGAHLAHAGAAFLPNKFIIDLGGRVWLPTRLRWNEILLHFDLMRHAHHPHFSVRSNRCIQRWPRKILIEQHHVHLGQQLPYSLLMGARANAPTIHHHADRLGPHNRDLHVRRDQCIAGGGDCVGQINQMPSLHQRLTHCASRCVDQNWSGVGLLDNADGNCFAKKQLSSRLARSIWQQRQQIVGKRTFHTQKVIHPNRHAQFSQNFWAIESLGAHQLGFLTIELHPDQFGALYVDLAVMI